MARSHARPATKQSRLGPPLILTPALHGHYQQPDPSSGPRLDYLEFARKVNGQVLHAEIAAGWPGKLEARTRRFGDWRQASRARGTDARVFLSMTEKTALGIVAVDRSRPHVAITQHLTSDRRRALQRWTRWLGRLDRVIALSRRQEDYILSEAGVPRERVRLVLRGVDQQFFAPQGGDEEGYVVSAGQTGRDYATLIEAARRTGLPTVIAAASPWVTEEAKVPENLPSNLSVQPRLDRVALRDLYDRASVIVVPLNGGTEIAAGVNATLEAMAMRKPVVVSATPGIADYVRDDETGVLVAANDPDALGRGLDALLRDADRRRRLAAAARATVETERSLDVFADNVAAVLAEVVELDQPSPATTTASL
ncbi:MAG: glycosyltransferase family 4 protein [Solirubrobacteraceae bacterium]